MSLVEELQDRSTIELDDHLEECRYVELDDHELYALLTRPRSRSVGGAVIACPSIFEHAVLQVPEIRFLRAAAVRGVSGIYLQPPGVGESVGRVSPTDIRPRVDTALAARETLLRRDPEAARVFFFGARWGAPVAVLAAQRVSGAGLLLWDPIFDVDDYLGQLRRLSRISAVASGSRKVRDPMQRLRDTGRTSILGMPVTAEQMARLGEAASGWRSERIDGPVLVVAMSEAAAARAALLFEGVASDVEVEALGRRDLSGLGMSVREAPEAIDPSIRWMAKKLA